MIVIIFYSLTTSMFSHFFQITRPNLISNLSLYSPFLLPLLRSIVDFDFSLKSQKTKSESLFDLFIGYISLSHLLLTYRSINPLEVYEKCSRVWFVRIKFTCLPYTDVYNPLGIAIHQFFDDAWNHRTGRKNVSKPIEGHYLRCFHR